LLFEIIKCRRSIYFFMEEPVSEEEVSEGFISDFSSCSTKSSGR